MKTSSTGDHLAVLIDADNVSSKVIVGLMAEVANYGTASVKRIYGDWTSPGMKTWRDCLLEHSIVPIQQFAYTTGKNATDGAMIIDAMDLLYTARFSSFCLVSSDSDFTRLAARIREQGVSVYGFGHRKTTHRAFVAACNEFVYFDALPMRADEAQEATAPPQPSPAKPSASNASNHSGGAALLYSPPTGPRALHQSQPGASSPYFQHAASVDPKPRPLDPAVLEALRNAINNTTYHEEDYVNLADIGHYLVQISPDFKARNYGFRRLLDFVLASDMVQLRMKTIDSGPPIALVRLKK